MRDNLFELVTTSRTFYIQVRIVRFIFVFICFLYFSVECVKSCFSLANTKEISLQFLTVVQPPVPQTIDIKVHTLPCVQVLFRLGSSKNNIGRVNELV